jgi:DNA recombination protein RmuC
LGAHFGRLGERLDGAVEEYNKSVGALEGRVLSSARRFRDLGAANGDKEIRELTPVEREARPVQREELLESGAVARRLAEEGAATAKQARLLDTSEE